MLDALNMGVVPTFAHLRHSVQCMGKKNGNHAESPGKKSKSMAEIMVTTIFSGSCDYSLIVLHHTTCLNCTDQSSGAIIWKVDAEASLSR